MLGRSIEKRRLMLVFIVAHALACGVECCAQRVASGLSAQEAFVDSEVVFQIRVRNAQRHQPPELPEIDGLRIVSAGTPSRSSNLSIINGRRESSSTVTYSFVITPLREGTFTIPPIKLEVDGGIETTEPHTIVVNTSETGDLLFAEISCDVQQAYVGQAVNLKLHIWVRPYADRGFEYRFSEGDMWQLFSRQTDWGIFAGRLEELGQENRRPAGQEVLRKDEQGVSRAYLLYEIENTMYPKRPGKIDPGNVRIVVNYPTKLAAGGSRFFDDDFFGPSLFDQLTRSRSIKVAASRPISATATLPPFQVLDVPSSGRPVEYRGAVGKYRFVVQAEPRRVKVGDPIALKMLIQGDGPMDLIEAPPLATIGDLVRDFKVDSKSLAGFVQNDAKLFTTSIRPLREDVVEIPSIPFAYFDPEQQQFRTAYSDPISITVEANESLSLDSIVANRRPTINAEDTDEAGVSPQDRDEGILGLDQMLRSTPSSSSTDLQPPWTLFLVPPLCCAVVVALLKWHLLGDLVHFKQDPKAMAIRAVREASSASQIRDALNVSAASLPSGRFEAIRQIQRRCDQSTFGGAAQRVSLRDLKQQALQALRITWLVAAFACGFLNCDQLHADVVSSVKPPPLHLSTQQIETLLAEALAAHQHARQLEEADPVSAKVQFEQAISKYELVVESGFQSAALYRNLADALAEQGELGNALAALEQARRWAPRDPAIANRIRELRKQLGTATTDMGALEAWRNFLNFLPDVALQGASLVSWTLACVLGTYMLVAPRFRRRRYLLMCVVMIAVAGMALYVHMLAREDSEAIAIAEAELRSANGDAFAVVAQLRTGDAVHVHDQRGRWLLVEAGSDSKKFGWTPAENLRILQ